MRWPEIRERLRVGGHGEDIVHRLVEAFRDDIYSGALSGGLRITGEKELAGILGVSRSTLREALRILVSEGLLVSRWGVGTFVTEQLPSVVKGLPGMNNHAPPNWVEPSWPLFAEDEIRLPPDDPLFASFNVLPGQNLLRRRRTYGTTGRVLAIIDETAVDVAGTHPAGRCSVTLDVATSLSPDIARLFAKDEPLLRISQTLFDREGHFLRLTIVVRTTRDAPLRLQE